MKTPAYGQPIGPQNDGPFLPMEGFYYAGMWYLEMTKSMSMFGSGGNMTCQLLCKIEDPSAWYFVYRLRHYLDQVVFGSEDLYRWHQYQFEAKDEADALNRIDEFFSKMRSRWPERIEVEKFIIQGDGEKLIERIQQAKPSWMQVQQVTVE